MRPKVILPTLILVGLSVLALLQLSKACGSSHSAPDDTFDDFDDDWGEEYTAFCDSIVSAGLNIGSGRVITYDSVIYSISELSDENTLWIRYSAGTCSTCIDKIHSWLEQLKSQNPETRINIALSNVGFRTLYVVERENHKHFSYYGATNLAVDYDEGSHTPIAFRLNSDGTIQGACIYDMDNTGIFHEFIFQK
ncbi:MAG: hypothetical protein NC336_09895 [Clostridium sp.]|nr:hypothetical protein [Clostridium sp.]